MFSFLPLDKIASLLLAWRYGILFPLCVVEGPITTVIAGFFVSLGYFNFFLVYLIVVAGDIVGDLFYYSIGYWGVRRFAGKGKFFGIKAERVYKFEKRFNENPGRIMLFGKWTQSIGAITLVAAGVSRVPIKTFLKFALIGTFPKSLLLLIIGYYFGQAYRQINNYFFYSALSMFAAFALIAIIYIAVRRFKARFKIE